MHKDDETIDNRTPRRVRVVSNEGTGGAEVEAFDVFAGERRPWLSRD